MLVEEISAVAQRGTVLAFATRAGRIHVASAGKPFAEYGHGAPPSLRTTHPGAGGPVQALALDTQGKYIASAGALPVFTAMQQHVGVARCSFSAGTVL